MRGRRGIHRCLSLCPDLCRREAHHPQSLRHFPKMLSKITMRRPAGVARKCSENYRQIAPRLMGRGARPGQMLKQCSTNVDGSIVGLVPGAGRQLRPTFGNFYQAWSDSAQFWPILAKTGSTRVKFGQTLAPLGRIWRNPSASMFRSFFERSMFCPTPRPAGSNLAIMFRAFCRNARCVGRSIVS